MYGRTFKMQGFTVHLSPIHIIATFKDN